MGLAITRVGALTSRIIAVGNLKGGTGKSTVAVNLACRLAESQAVTLVDADPQGTAAAWLQDGEAKGMPRLLEVVSRPLGAGVGSEPWQAEMCARRHHYGRIVIDLPPQKGEAFQAALQIADLLIVPVTPSAVDLHATAQALAVLHQVREARGGRPACLLVPSKVDRRLAQGRKAGALLEKLGCEVATALAQRASHVEAFSAAAWIGAYAQGTPAHDDICVLAREVEDQLARCPAPEPFVPSALRAGSMRAGKGAAPGIAAGLAGLVALLRPRLRRPDLAALLRLRPSASLRQQ
jgi:chromosome partitioning protein